MQFLPSIWDIVIASYGYTALDLAAYYGNTEAFTRLLEKKDQVRSISLPSQQTILDRLISWHRWDFIQLILDYYVNQANTELQQDFIKNLENDYGSLFELPLTQIKPLIEITMQKQENLPMSIKISELPAIQFANSTCIKVSNFNEPDSNQQPITFYSSLIRLETIPGSENSIQFLEKLQQVDNKDIFTTPLITYYICQKFDYLKPIMRCIALQYLIYLLSFSVFYLNLSSNYILWYSAIGTNILLISYEMFHLYIEGVRTYFADAWNYVDLSSMFLSLILLWKEKDSVPLHVVTFTLILLWLRGITYFNVFDMTRALIKLILESFKDMISFLIFLIYTNLAFTFLFLSTQKEQDEFGTLIKSVYLMSLGDWNTEGLSEVQWGLLISTTLINLVVMMNLLISIIGDTYERVQMNRESNDMQGKLEQILEIEKCLLWNRKKSCTKYMQVCREFVESQGNSSWNGRVRIIVNDIKELKEVVNGKMEIQEQKMQTQDQKLQAIEQELSNVKETIGIVLTLVQDLHQK